MKEAVNHPAHYNAGKIEVIEAIEDWALGFCDGNVVKYVARFRHKNGIEDLKKAQWYLNRLIQQEQEKLNVEVRSKGHQGFDQSSRKEADDNYRDLSEIHSQRSDDASGPSAQCGEQQGNPVAEDDVRDFRFPSYPTPFRQRAERNANGR